MATVIERQCLQTLLDESWELYRRCESAPFIIRRCIPILFFGDSSQYFNSPLRIITVGLNPSKSEFPEDNHFIRFPKAEQDKTTCQPPSTQLCLETLNAYFYTNPYRRWFDAYEILLDGFDCSFYGNRTNTALHTDLCSPLATDPTWAKLRPQQKEFLEHEGVTLWHSLVECLRPDLILISVAQRYLAKIRFPDSRGWQVIYTLPRHSPYHVRAKASIVGKSKRTVLVFGRAAQTPFGTVSKKDKMKIAEAAKSFLDANAR